jgi:multifunctional methyltransferase subunit TRM112
MNINTVLHYAVVGSVRFIWAYLILVVLSCVNVPINIRTENGYPLQIEATTLKYEESPVNKEFLLNLLPKVNYPALKSAVQQIGPHCDPPLPELPESIDTSDLEAIANLDDETITNLHKCLLNVYLVEGWLVCPDTGRKFPVKECIPNMILHEDEI